MAKTHQACYLMDIPEHNKFLHCAVEDAKKLAWCSREMEHLVTINNRMRDIKHYDFPDSNQSLYLENQLVLNGL